MASPAQSPWDVVASQPDPSPWDIVQPQTPAGNPPQQNAAPSGWDIVSSQPNSSDGGLLHNLWEEGVVNPAKQAASGYFRASEGAAHMLGNAADIAGKVTGTPPGGFFRDAERYYDEKAEELSGGRKDVASQIYQGIGAAPVDIAKYTAASEALGPVAGMAAADALSAEDKGTKQALLAGAKGALTGAGLHLMAPASARARVAGGAAMFGSQTAIQGGSPWDIVASAVTGGVMGGTSGAENEFSEMPEQLTAPVSPMETSRTEEPPALAAQQPPEMAQTGTNEQQAAQTALADLSPWDVIASGGPETESSGQSAVPAPPPPEVDSGLYQKAVDLVRANGKASTSSIQRALRVPYDDASQMLERMESEGIVGPAHGSKPRAVLPQEAAPPAPIVPDRAIKPRVPSTAAAQSAQNAMLSPPKIESHASAQNAFTLQPEDAGSPASVPPTPPTPADRSGQEPPVFIQPPQGIEPATVEQPKGTYAPATHNAAPVQPEDATGAASRQNAPAGIAAAFSPESAGQPGSQSEALPGPDQPGDSVGYGKGTIVRIPGEDSGLEARYALRELSDLQGSHSGITFQPNPAYQLRNDRDYSDPRNSERVLRQASQFDPAYLVADSPDALNGAPVIDQSGNVLGGNSRVMTLERVFTNHPDAAQSYRDALASNAQAFGIDPDAIAAMNRPVLVREVSRELTPEETQQAVTNLNKAGTAQLTPGERALADSRQVSPQSLNLIGQKIEEQGPDGTLAQALQGGNGPQIVQTLIGDGVISPQEKSGLLNERGQITAAGKDRVSKLLTGRFFSDASGFDSTPPELRNKLERISAPVARLTPGSAWDLTPHIQEALNLLEDARQHGIRNLGDLRAQQNMFGEAAYSPEAFAVAKTLQQSPLKVTQAFRQYAGDANYAEGGNLIGNAPTPAEAFQTAFPDSSIETSAASAPLKARMPPPGSAAKAAGNPGPAGRPIAMRRASMPPPGTVRNGESGGIPADLLTAPARAVGLDKFIQQDVIPAVAGGARKASGAMDDIKTLLAPQTRGPAAPKAAGMIRERGANLAQLRDRAVAALRQAKAYFAAKPPDYNLRFIDAVENGNTSQLPPQERQFAGTMRQLIDERSALLQKLGLLKTFYVNYFPHLWKDPDAAAHWLQNWFSKRPLAGSEAYRKQRTYPTVMDGINDPNFHMQPAFTNPVDFVMAKLGEMDKSITAHQIVEGLKSTGDLQPLPNGQRPPAGMARIDDRIASGYTAPEQLATVINNHLAPGLSQSPLFQVWRGLNNTMNLIDLSLSYYHGLTTTLNASLSDMALGLKQAAAGKPIRGLSSAARGFIPFASVAQDVMKGTKLLKVWDGAPAPDPMTAAVVDALKAGGGRARQDSTYAQHYADGFLQALRSYNLPGAALRLPFAALEKAMAPLMEYMVPRAKLGVFAKRAQMEIEAHPGMAPDQARAAFGKIWDSVDNRFGQFVYNNLFANKIAKDLMMAAVGRPGWNIGTVREIGGGMADLAKAALAPLSGNKPELSDRAAFTTALFLGGAAINGLTNYLLTGTPPQGVDYLAPRDGGLNEDGRPSRIVLPTYLSKDLYSYATRPLATLKAKAAPALTAASDLLTNRDFQNRPIYGRNGIGMGEYAKETVTPYAVQGIERNLEGNKTPARTILPLVGVMPAGRQVGKSKAEQLMAQYEEEALPSTRAPQSERNRLKSHITGLVRAGNRAAALQTATDAFHAGKLTSGDINQAIDRAELSPLVADFKRLTLDQALDVTEIASPAERRQLMPELAGRLDRAFNRLPPAEQARIEQRIQKVGAGSR